jgi:hypothetical protein
MVHSLVSPERTEEGLSIAGQLATKKLRRRKVFLIQQKFSAAARRK